MTIHFSVYWSVCVYCVYAWRHLYLCHIGCIDSPSSFPSFFFFYGRLTPDSRKSCCEHSTDQSHFANDTFVTTKVGNIARWTGPRWAQGGYDYKHQARDMIIIKSISLADYQLGIWCLSFYVLVSGIIHPQ